MNGLVGFDLRGKTVGIVGTRKIGKIAAQIFRDLGTDVLAFDPFPADEWAASLGVRYSDFETLLSASHVVSPHLPLTPPSH